MQTSTEAVRSEGASTRRETSEPDALRARFDRLRAAHRADPAPSYEQRIAWLDTLIRLVADNRQAIADAINADFGSRSYHETQIAEVFTLITGIRYRVSNTGASTNRGECCGFETTRPMAAISTRLNCLSDRIRVRHSVARER